MSTQIFELSEWFHTFESMQLICSTAERIHSLAEQSEKVGNSNNQPLYTSLFNITHYTSHINSLIMPGNQQMQI